MSANCILEYIHALKKSQPLGAQVAAHDLQTPISGELRNISEKEVGGWHKAHRMKMGCGVVYDANSEKKAVNDFVSP
jgi:hypothetical protein